MTARRRVRYYPPARRRPGWCARIAARSAELGSLEAVFDEADQERAAKAALADARAREVDAAVAAVAWRAEEQEAYRRWRAAPLQVPEWADGQGWPEPDGAAS